MTSQRTVVLGNGMVGHRFVREFRQRDPHSQLTVTAAEHRLVYDRVHLSHYLDTPPPDHALATAGNDAWLNVTVLFAAALGIDRAGYTASGAVRYDTPVLTTGTGALVPPFPGQDERGCFVYRTRWACSSASLPSTHAASSSARAPELRVRPQPDQSPASTQGPTT